MPLKGGVGEVAAAQANLYDIIMPRNYKLGVMVWEKELAILLS